MFLPFRNPKSARLQSYIFISLIFLLFLATSAYGEENKRRKFTVMEYNVENLFDCQHDSLKDDHSFTPEGEYHWTHAKYWRKLNAVARGMVLASQSGGESLNLPDIIGLCEVENDSVVHSLVHRSLLSGAGYEYFMTSSPDRRGIDVALLYQPASFRPISHSSLRVDTLPGMRPTRDILYVNGETHFGQIHIFVVHAPSRSGGELKTQPARMIVAQRITAALDSIRMQENDANILVMGDFNDYDDDPALCHLLSCRLTDVTSVKRLTLSEDINGTYRFQGRWGSLDHILVSPSLLSSFRQSRIATHPDLLEPDTRYGGLKPYRFFRGPMIHGGFSDHLPLVATFEY